MNEWLKGVEKPTQQHIMLAQAHYQKRNFDLALSNVDKAIELEKSRRKTSQGKLVTSEISFILWQRDYPNTAKTYEDLVKYYPKVDYLKQLERECMGDR